MKTIILVYPKIDFEGNYPCSWIPYSILSIAGAIPQNKYRVLIFDENKQNFDEFIATENISDVFLIGISIMTGGAQIKNALKIAEFFKQKYPHVYTVFGGPHVNVLPEQTVQEKLVDFSLQGMAQLSFAELVRYLDDGGEIDGISGLYYKKNGVVFKTTESGKAAKSEETVKFIPYNFDLINVENYIRYDATIADKTINYISSLGCPHACRFCYEYVYGRKYVAADFDCVKLDIESFVQKHSVNGIKFYDADFFVNSERSIKIMSELKKHNISWAASVNPREILGRQKENGSNLLLKAISDSKCKRLLMGMESGSPRVLSNIVGKNITPENMFFVAQSILKHEILGSYTFIVGYPDETPEEQELTFKFIKQLKEMDSLIEVKVHIYFPYPGTPLYKRALKLGFSPPVDLMGWADFNYYRAETPWTDKKLEDQALESTRLINKNDKKYSFYSKGAII